MKEIKLKALLAQDNKVYLVADIPASENNDQINRCVLGEVVGDVFQLPEVNNLLRPYRKLRLK